MSIVNFNNTTPAAPGGNTNVTWQQSGDSVSAYVPNSVTPLTTKGDLLGYDTGPDRVPIGTNGQVLTADSGQSLGLKWATPTTGALVLLEEHTASNSAELDFTSWYSTSYDDYVLEIVNIAVATAGSQLELQFSTNGGSSYDTGANYNWDNFIYRSSGSAVTGTNGDTKIIITSSGAGITSSTFGVCCTFRLMVPAGLAQLFGQVNYSDSTSLLGSQLAAQYTQTGANAFRILASAGNLSSGTVRVYGLSK